MSEEEVIVQFGEMWGKRINDYALKTSDTLVFGYIILDAIHNSMVVIEDDEAAKYVIGKMIEHGVRVTDDEGTIRTPNPPDPIFYAPELEVAYREFQERKKTTGNK